jgi:hypothetical protein
MANYKDSGFPCGQPRACICQSQNRDQAKCNAMTSMKKTLLNALLPVFLLLSAERASAWYDPGPQRWINRDPIAERGALNLYSFVFNDALNRVDPVGLDCMSQCLSGFLGDARTFCSIVAGCGVGAMGNIPGGSGRPIASELARYAFRESLRGVNPPVDIYLRGRALIGVNAAAAARAAAVVGAFMVGYGTGSLIQCAQQCYGGQDPGRQ